jgi:hypothetical protein
MRYRELLESLPHPDQLTKMDAVVDFAFRDIDWGGGGGATIMALYADDTDIDDENENDVSDTPEFKEWFDGWAEDRAWDIWGDFSHLFDAQGNATLYRVITAPPDWTPGNRHPGIYWSWDKDAAEAHWGNFNNGHVKFRLAAKINSSVVDWVITLGMNIQPDYTDEKEIRIQENAPVEILKIERLK